DAAGRGWRVVARYDMDDAFALFDGDDGLLIESLDADTLLWQSWAQHRIETQAMVNALAVRVQQRAADAARDEDEADQYAGALLAEERWYTEGR
ncbi:MAG: hypothetical protein WCG26_03960, partial [Chloroflexales bacterium]